MVLQEPIKELTLNQSAKQTYWPERKGKEMFAYQDKQLLVQRWALVIGPKGICGIQRDMIFGPRKQYITEMNDHDR